MVDRDDDDGPAMDLSAADPHYDPSLADRVIGHTMARIAQLPRPAMHVSSPPTVLADVARFWNPGLAAAALVLVAAGVTVTVASSNDARRPIDELVEARMLDWVQAGHIPTNGDLLSAFRGLAR